MARRTDDEPLRAIAEREEQDGERNHRDVRVEAGLEGEIGGEHSRPENRPMSEVDDVQHAIDQREANGDKGVDCPGRQAIDSRRRDDIGREQRPAPQAGIGKTGLASAKSVGKMTLMSPSCTCVLTTSAPVFWPLTNCVGP